MSDSKTRDAATGVDKPTSGASVRIPVTRTFEYDTAKSMSIKSLGLDCGYSLLPAGAEAIGVVDDVVTMTFNEGVSTLGTIQALLATDPAAADMIEITGTAGTLPALWAGSAANLWEDVYASAAIMLAADEDGNLVPFGGKSVVTTVEQADWTKLHTAAHPYLPVAGAAPTAVIGTAGRLNKDVTIQIEAGPPALSVVAHPLVGGVSVIGANGAAAAVSASGKVVTLTAKNDGSTDVTAMNVLIAAHTTVSKLIGPLTGTGADLFAATFSQAETALWESGTIPANLQCALGPDGYVWPVEMDATGGVKNSPASMGPGENGLSGSSRRVWSQVPGTFGTVLTDTGTLYASPCRLIGLIVVTTTAATAAGTLKDGGSGGTVKAPTFFNVIGSVFVPCHGGTFATDVYFTKGTTWAGSIVAVVDPAV